MSHWIFRGRFPFKFSIIATCAMFFHPILDRSVTRFFDHMVLFVLYQILSYASGMWFVDCIFHLVQTDHSIGSSIGFSVGTSWCCTSTYSLVHSCSVIARPQIFSLFLNQHSFHFFFQSFKVLFVIVTSLVMGFFIHSIVVIIVAHCYVVGFP